MVRSGSQQQTGQEDRERRQGQGLEAANAADDNPLGLEDLSSPSAPKPWRWLGLCVFVLLSMAMLATVLTYAAAREKKASLLEAEERRLQQSVLGRIETFRTWLEGRRSASRRLTDSHVFRLFINDLALQEPLSPLPRSLQDQRPYFRQLMTDFVRQNQLIRATVLREDGAVLLSSPGPLLSVDNLLGQVEEAGGGWRSLLSPIRHVEGQETVFVVDAMVPLPPAQTESDEAERVSAILVMTLPIKPILEETLSIHLVDPDHERLALIQQRGDVIDHFLMTEKGIKLTTEQSFDSIQPGTPAAFARRNAEAPIYSLGEPIPGVPWTLYHILDARTALSPIHDFIGAAAGFSAIAVLALTSAFSAFWWRQGRNHHRRLVDVYKSYAHKVDRQRQFLQSVTTSIGDWLVVCSPGGGVIYANPAFEAAAGQSKPLISGKMWGDLIDESSATATLENDLASLIDPSSFKLVDINGDRHVVSPHVSDLRAEDGSIQGTVHVVRDHTELFAERRRRLLAATQTIDAFIHAIELRDPFLLGHTRRLRAHAIAIGQKLGLSSNELASLALAASLSQIGKIFIPDGILTKPIRHDENETGIMRDHIRYTIEILERIDFDLPIVDILAQMYERLDGGGYPHGLSGDDIGLCARILGVADIFCARTAPRSYRERMSPGKALYHLASNGRRYDMKVVAVLAEIVGQDHQLTFPETIERTFFDADIWRRKESENASELDRV